MLHGLKHFQGLEIDIHVSDGPLTIVQNYAPPWISAIDYESN